jgi:hypothetical protein
MASADSLRSSVRLGSSGWRTVLRHLLRGARRTFAGTRRCRDCVHGYLTTTGAIPYPVAYVAAVSGAVLGSACSLTVSRRYGRPFIQRLGRYIAIIVGRHIPGMRMVIVSPIWNTWRPLQGICTVRSHLGFDLGGDLPRAETPARTPCSGAFQLVPSPFAPLANPGFDLASDRVSGI